MSKNDSIEIRRALCDDAEAIARVHIDSWRAAYRGLMPDSVLDGLSVERRSSEWRAWLALPEISTFLVTKSGSLVGFCTLIPSRDEDAGPNVAEIPAIYVHPSFWRQGIGQFLCAKTIEEARKREFAAVTLWVLDSNRKAIKFYESIGFCVDGKTKTDTELTGTPLHEVRFRLELSIDPD